MKRFTLKSIVEQILQEKCTACSEIKYTMPNFKFEWKEAIRYPELKQLGKSNWIDIAQRGFIVEYSKIKKFLSNTDLNFNNLDTLKKKRFIQSFNRGIIEMPIVLKFSSTDYDLIAGNTRLAGLIKNNIEPKLWVIDISNNMNEMDI